MKLSFGAFILLIAAFGLVSSNKLPDWVCEKVMEEKLCDGNCPQLGEISDPSGEAIYACAVNGQVDETLPYSVHCPKHCSNKLPDWVCEKVMEENLCDGTCPQLGEISDPSGEAIYACAVNGQVDETLPYSDLCPKLCHNIECSMETKQCDDGSFVGRDEKNFCEFHACPIGRPCTTDVKRCDDGSFVGRDHKNFCEFHACPITHEPAAFCKASQQQRCKMKCAKPECPSKGMCAMRQGSCCDYVCVEEPEEPVCPQVKCAEQKGCKVKKSNKLDQNGCPKFPCGKVKKCRCGGNDAEWSDAQRKWCCKRKGKGCQSIPCESRTIRKQCRGPAPGPGFAQCAWNKSGKRCESQDWPVAGRPFRSLEGTALLATAQQARSDAAWDVRAPEF